LTLILGKQILVLLKLNSRLILGYSPGLKFDGLGAQLQRVLAINALAEYWGIEVAHSPIKKIAIHPLDGLESRDSYVDFLNNVNGLIDAQSQFKLRVQEIYTADLTFKSLIRVIKFQLKSKEKIYLTVTHPYYFVDANPRIYNCKFNMLISDRLLNFSTESLKDSIVLHHRHGVGKMAIQPGQKSPREIEMDKITGVVMQCIARNSNAKKMLHIFTDAPDHNLQFHPPSDQVDSWTNLPGFDGQVMSVNAGTLEGLTNQISIPLKVHRGGNPLNSLANLATAGTLILTRSSFGYIAAILGKTQNVWAPRDFWHPLLDRWHSYLAK
jgi:hypothetical protein